MWRRPRLLSRSLHNLKQAGVIVDDEAVEDPLKVMESAK
jgi:hypothetical protein